MTHTEVEPYASRVVLDVARLQLVRRVSTDLSSLPLADINLLLYGAGIEPVTSNQWWGTDEYSATSESDRQELAQHLVIGLATPDLRDLAFAMQALFQTTAVAELPDEPPPLKVFASHLTAQKELLHAIKASLDSFGVQLFVAHDDVEPDSDWQIEIESALQTAHAGVVFMFQGFRESEWCDQEAGWLLGRGVPVRRLLFNDYVPHGLLGRKQGLGVPLGQTGPEIAGSILEWLRRLPDVRGELNSSLALAMTRTSTPEQTDAIWSLLDAESQLTAGQVATIATAVRDNQHVYDGVWAGTQQSPSGMYADIVLASLERQPGAAISAAQLAEAKKAVKSRRHS